MTTFPFNGKEYTIKYTLKRVELYENRVGTPLITSLRNNGAFSLSELKTIVAYGLCQDGTDDFLSYANGIEVAEGVIEEVGYTSVFDGVAEALQRDCGFLFRVTSQG